MDIAQIAGNGAPQGPGVLTKLTLLQGLAGVFEYSAALAAMPGDTLVYSVAWHQPVPLDTPGGGCSSAGLKLSPGVWATSSS